MNQHGHDSNCSAAQALRSVVVKGIQLAQDQRESVLQLLRQHSCLCVECSSLRVKLDRPCVKRQNELGLPECTVLVNSLITIGCAEASYDVVFRDRALDSAGTICWQMGDAFHLQCRDFPAHLLHTVSQNHSRLRDVIEAKRLLLWFHRDLDQMTPMKMRVTHFEFDAELCGLAGVVFNDSTRLAVRQAAEKAVAGWRKQGLF